MRYFDGWRWADGVLADQSAFDHFGTAGEPGREPHPTLPLSAAVGALVILAASLTLSKLIAELLGDIDIPVLLDAALGIAIGYGPSVWWCWRVRRTAGDGFGDLGWRFRWIDVGWAPLLWVGAVIGQVIVVAISTELGVPFESNVDSAEGRRTAAYVIALVASAVVAAPVVEELVFRGVVLRGLVSRMHVVVAVIVQGVLFGWAHYDPSRGAGNIGLALGLSTVGCAMGLVTVLTRRIGAAVLAHALLNGFVVIMLLAGVTDDLDREFDTLVALIGR